MITHIVHLDCEESILQHGVSKCDRQALCNDPEVVRSSLRTKMQGRTHMVEATCDACLLLYLEEQANLTVRDE